jgi:hypothetical protein
MAMCSVCRRNLLTGERFRLWQERPARPRTVCLLCEGEARKLRWLRVEDSGEQVNANGLVQTVRKVA